MKNKMVRLESNVFGFLSFYYITNKNTNYYSCTSYIDADLFYACNYGMNVQFDTYYYTIKLKIKVN